MLWLQSGKLVTKMFQKIQDLIDDKDALVFVLIDEVGLSMPHLGGCSGPLQVHPSLSSSGRSVHTHPC